MPNVTTYIRKADMELWAACPNKAELIHNALRGLELKTLPPVIKKGEFPKKAVLKNFSPIVDGTEVTLHSRFDGPLCKIHGLPLDGRGKCLQKDCKYAR